MTGVSVVSVGARTPVGLDAVQTGFLLRAGLPGVGESPLADPEGEPVPMGTVPVIDGAICGARRLVELARPALIEAAGPARERTVEVHLAIDTGLPDEAAAIAGLTAMVEAALPRCRVAVSARGEAGLVAALPGALRALALRQADAVIVGGAHSDHDPRAIAALHAAGRLFRRDNLDSRIPGEAAAFVVLARTVDTGATLPRLCDVLGHGLAASAGPGEEGGGMSAQALSAAVKEATAPLRAEGSAAGWLWTDMTTEMARVLEWGASFVRAHEVFTMPYYVDAPAQRIGYLGAAALPLFAATAAIAWRHGYAPAGTALGLAGADSGERAALLLRSGRESAGKE